MSASPDRVGSTDGTEPAPVKILFCGDRPVAAELVKLIRGTGADIVGLGLNTPPFADHDEEIRSAAEVDGARVFYGRSFFSDLAVRRFAAAEPDLGICCGFASILPTKHLDMPRWGWVNLHRSYLPYNRGLDPLQWAMVERTPAGVSLHVMSEAIDAGPVLAQRELPIVPTDNFHTLSEKADALVLELFEECWPRLQRGDLTGSPQDEDLATYHSWTDCQRLRHLDLRATMPVGRLLDILRGYSSGGVSGIHFDVGPLRFSVHTEVRVAQRWNQPPRRPAEQRPQEQVHPASAKQSPQG